MAVTFEQRLLIDMFGERVASGERLFFIQGIWRSGTTWVGRMIDSQPQLYVCGRELQSFSKQYETTVLGRPVIDDPFFSVRYQAVRKVGFLSMLLHLHAREKPGADLIGERSPGGDVLYLKESFPHAKLIIMVRDGKDICISTAYSYEKYLDNLPDTLARPRHFAAPFVAEGDGQLHLDAAYVKSFAHTYQSYVLDFLALKERHPGTVHLVKYETLLSDTANTLHGIFAFLDVDLDMDTVEDICREHAFESEIRRDPNLSGVSANRKGIVGDWREHFTDEILSMFESNAGEALRAAGYDLFTRA